jgi:hypothetical protein
MKRVVRLTLVVALSGCGAGPVLNELLPYNQTGILDEAYEAEDWVELYNPGATSVRLDGWGLADDPDDVPWEFPDGVEIPGGGYVLVWTDGDVDDGPMHADFRLSRDGESLLLFDPDGLVADQV